MKKKKVQRIVQLIIALVLLLLVGIIFVQFTSEDRLQNLPASSFMNVEKTPSDVPMKETEKPIAFPTPKQGSITIVNLDADTQLPIMNSEFVIFNASTLVIVETIKTDQSGKATSRLLDYGTSYMIKQQEVMKAYNPTLIEGMISILNDEHAAHNQQSDIPTPMEMTNDTALQVEISAPNHELTVHNRLFNYVTEVERSEDGQLNIKSIYLDVGTVIQLPELPNGCEITSNRSTQLLWL